MQRIQARALILSTALLLALMGCKAGNESAAEPAGDKDVASVPNAVSLEDMYGSVWRLVNLQGDAIGSGIDITLKWADDGEAISGSSGCNGYNASISGSAEAFQITHVASTKRMCMGPDNLMQIESQYINALGQVNSVESRDQQLVLLTPEDELVFGKKTVQ